MTLDVESIERATLAAVMPPETYEAEGWLVGLGAGPIRRARSAAPLRHDLACDPAAISRIEAAYANRNLKRLFRLADVQGLAAIRDELERRGYGFAQPTLVKIGDIGRLHGLGSPGEIIEAPDAAWAAVFLGEGFDPIEGADRMAALEGSKAMVFGQVRDGGETVAVGAAALSHGWASFHGMRTAKARRGEGFAGRVLAALGEAAARRGIQRLFLQVEEDNTPARALYRRAGFEQVWRYHYGVREA